MQTYATPNPKLRHSVLRSAFALRHRSTSPRIKLNAAAMSNSEEVSTTMGCERPPKTRLRGRAFYESLGSPKYILAPMVNQSEFAWRMLTRSFMPPEKQREILAYSPMMHAKHFGEKEKYRAANFLPTKSSTTTPLSQPVAEDDLYLDGNPKFDRPLFVQFCANDPDALLAAAQHAQPFCDAVDLNLGCPQGIARKGHYGAFLQEDWDLIAKMIRKVDKNLDIPITAKMRILDSKKRTLQYAKTILDAGASILTVHGRQREQKGHNTGVADWSVIRYLREQLPPDTVMFANGNILQHSDIEECLRETGVDGVMSAEGNLYDPTIFAEPPPVGQEGREYWRGKDGKGGYRMDAVMRRYLDILYKYVLDKDPPERLPLFLPSDLQANDETEATVNAQDVNPDSEGPPRKKAKVDDVRPKGQNANPNLGAIQPHLFSILRPLVSVHHDVRDALARCRGYDIESLENILTMVERATKQGILDAEQSPSQELQKSEEDLKVKSSEPSDAISRCKRPFFICQPYIRPLPAEALEKGSLQLSKKEKKRLAQLNAERSQLEKHATESEKPEIIRNDTGTVQQSAVYG